MNDARRLRGNCTTFFVAAPRLAFIATSSAPARPACPSRHDQHVAWRRARLARKHGVTPEQLDAMEKRIEETKFLDRWR